jgi:hypothetical protein
MWEFEQERSIDMENTLRGAVLAKYKSISSFADVLNWDRKKASRIVNRQQLPSAKDMEQMATHLDIKDGDTFVRVFLPSLPTKWETKD